MGPEWIIVGLIAVVVLFGAKKLPEMARSVGRAQGEFKKGIKEGNVDEPTESTESKSQAESRALVRVGLRRRLVLLLRSLLDLLPRFRTPQLPGDPPEDAVHVPA